MSVNVRKLSRMLLQIGTAGTIVISATVPVAAAPQIKVKTISQTSQTIRVMLDKKELLMKTPPLFIKGNLMLPAKVLFEQAGVKMMFEKGTITVVAGTEILKGNLNSNKVLKGQQTFVLLTAPVVLKGILYVPAKFAALGLDRDITYDSTNQRVLIHYSDQQMLEFQRTLVRAARIGKIETLKAAINHGVDLDLKLKEYGGSTALDYALHFNQTEAARILFEHGAKVFRPVSATYVIQAGNGDLMEMLLTHGLDPNWKLNGVSLLNLASGKIWSTELDGTEKVISPNLQIVNALLQQGADPSYDDSLSKAVQAHSYEIIQALLQHGADPYRADSLGVTPYSRAQLDGISSWMALAPVHATPALSIRQNNGNSITEGIIFIAAQQGFPGAEFHWTGDEVYLDLPDGEYKLSGIMSSRGSYLLTDNQLKVESGVAIPSSIQLPATNVSGTLTGAPEKVQNGLLSIESTEGNHLVFAEVVNGHFDLSLPPGIYQFGSFGVGDQKMLLNQAPVLTIPTDGTSQQVMLSLSEGL